MKILLIVVGVLAAVAWAFPSLVLLGYFLILPGVVLLAAPSAFLYLLAAFLIRLALPLKPGVPATAASLALALLLGWAVNQPGRWAEMRRYDALLEPDVLPAEPLTLDGVVSLERRELRPRDEQPPLCGPVCAALLDTPGVASVIAGPADGRRRLRLVPGGPGEGVRPHDPGALLDAFSRLDLQEGRPPEDGGGIAAHKLREQRREALNAAWTLRLAARESIAAGAPPAEPPDWTVRIIDEQIPREDPMLQRLEILDRSGEVRLRRSVLKHSVPSRFFHFTLLGGFENPHLAPARTLVADKGRYAELDAEVELLRHARIARPAAPDDARESLRRAASDAAGDPAAGPRRLAAAREWLRLLDRDEAERHEALIARIVRDVRIGGLIPELRRLYLRTPPAALRAGCVARILAPAATPEERGHYARMLARMPAGTFARPTEDERRIWGDASLRRQAAPFLERLADQGEAGLEPMLAALREAVALKYWHERRPIVRELRRGFARLGPAGAPALPYLRGLAAARPSPLLQSAREGFEWRTTLVVMGLPVEELPYPPNLTPERIAAESARIRKAAAEYDPDERDGY